MIRERALKITIAVVGILFCLGAYPVVMMLLHPDIKEDTGDGMMMGLYAALGVFLLRAVRNPAEHRSLIAFTAWSSFAHALVMGTMGFQFVEQRTGFLIGSGVLVLIGVALLALSASERSRELAPSAAANVS